MYSQGTSHAPHPLEKTLEDRYNWIKCIFMNHNPIFQGQLNEKKIRSITLKVWVLGRVKKYQKQDKKCQKYFHRTDFLPPCT